jgi:hypothetical protein
MQQRVGVHKVVNGEVSEAVLVISSSRRRKPREEGGLPTSLGGSNCGAREQEGDG